MSTKDVVNDFEAWADVSAKLIGKGADEQQRLLADMGLSLVWKNANAAWSRALASDIVDMRLHRAQRYAEICANVLAADRIEVPNPLSLSQSDDLSRQTTHRMRAIAPHLQSFAEITTPAQPVRPPTRRQALTHDAPRDFDVPFLGDSIDDSAQTSVLDLNLSTADGDDAWPLERYARYVAEREAARESAASVDARYNLDIAHRNIVVRAWHERLIRDPELKGRYDALVAAHTETLGR